METLLYIAAWFTIAVFLFQIYTSTPKKRKNERSPQNKKKSKLLRFQRGNKTLTPEQQKELEKVSKSNYATLKQMWKDEHL